MVELGIPVCNYKDSVFRMFFSEKTALSGLYNALNGTAYTAPEELEVNTLQNAICLGRKNDISFIIQSQLYLYEHQSTANHNMTLRNLFYLAELYTRLVGVELTTVFVNINKGYNERLKENCRDLHGYMIYVDRVRENAKRYSLDLAVELAIDSCIREGILSDFLSKRRAEVMSMSIYEYDQEKHFRQIA